MIWKGPDTWVFLHGWLEVGSCKHTIFIYTIRSEDY
jgi:hypothetical protein